jgi:hypothetical protein
MKWIAIAVLLVGTTAFASITLTTAYGVAGPASAVAPGGSAAYATATGKMYDWTANTACMTYSFGTVLKRASQDTGFTVLQGAPNLVLCLNLTSGYWITSGGYSVSSGTLAGAGLVNANTVYTGPLTALRNATDSFAASTFLPGAINDTW